MSLVRLAALITVGGSVPCYGAHADAAGTPAQVAEIVAVLDGHSIVGLPRVAGRPSLALALGYDTDDAFSPAAPRRGADRFVLFA